MCATQYEAKGVSVNVPMSFQKGVANILTSYIRISELLYEHKAGFMAPAAQVLVLFFPHPWS
jgi:hypothetical protein